MAAIRNISRAQDLRSVKRGFLESVCHCYILYFQALRPSVTCCACRSPTSDGNYGILIMQFSRLVFSLLLFGLLSCNKQATPVAAAKSDGPLTVRTVLAKGREIQRNVESVGTFYPMEEAIISAEIEGRAEEVRHDLGDLVNAGEVLVRI